MRHLVPFTLTCLVSITVTGVNAQSGFGSGEKPKDPVQQAEPLPTSIEAPTDAVSDAEPTILPTAEEPRAPIALAPSAFTPNGDGLNDKFYPRVGEVVTQGYLFHVFDRWGREIYSTNNPGEGWDGSLANGGAVLPQGVYVWRLVFQPVGSSESIKRLGSVALLL